jgi:hypothetical protein
LEAEVDVKKKDVYQDTSILKSASLSPSYESTINSFLVSSSPSKPPSQLILNDLEVDHLSVSSTSGTIAARTSDNNTIIEDNSKKEILLPVIAIPISLIVSDNFNNTNDDNSNCKGDKYDGNDNGNGTSAPPITTPLPPSEVTYYRDTSDKNISDNDLNILTSDPRVSSPNPDCSVYNNLPNTPNMPLPATTR